MINDFMYQNLANAIVFQAVNDYRRALRILRLNSRNRKAIYQKSELERFFHSMWYERLTSVDPDYLIKELKKEN